MKEQQIIKELKKSKFASLQLSEKHIASIFGGSGTLTVLDTDMESIE